MREQINTAMKTAMKEHDSATLSAVRMIMAAIKDKDINGRADGITNGISDEAIMALLQNMIKQRRESVRMYTEGKRQDLVDKENAEIAVIERFLPQQMDDAAVREAVKAAVAAVGAQTVRDMGKVMAELKTKYTGQMDFAKAGGIVKEAIGG